MAVRDDEVSYVRLHLAETDRQVGSENAPAPTGNPDSLVTPGSRTRSPRSAPYRTKPELAVEYARESIDRL